jgi:hypothetical protein
VSATSQLLRVVGLAVWLCLSTRAGAVPIVPSGPTTDWTPIFYPSATPDAGDDQSTGVDEADIVGDLTHAALYAAFDNAGTPLATDGNLGFRVRIGSEQNPPGFSQVLAIGIDADANPDIDLFLLVDNQGQNRIAIFDPGAGANTAPNNTTISSTGTTYAEAAGNYDWSPVDGTIDPLASSFDVDADGQTDYFLSFVVPFQDVVDALAANGVAGVDQSTALGFVVGTSTQANSFNQDLAGPPGGVNSSSGWGVLGAVSSPTAPSAMPEPDSAALLGLGLVALAWARRASLRATS